MPIEDIKIALERLKARLPQYAKYRGYYEGEHELGFATEEFRNVFGDLFATLAYNHCHLVVDTLVDRLALERFEVRDGPPEAADEAWQLWEQNKMEQRAGEVHQEAAQSGDAYLIVWPNKRGEPAFYPNPAAQMGVVYDDDEPGLITMAYKFWVTPQKRRRLNLYYVDRIEKYVVKESVPKSEDVSLPDKAEVFERWQVSGEAWPVRHEYGRVPVFHFANNAGVGKMGRSELKHVIAPQRALNKIAMDMLVSMEFNAFRQRWATGIDVPKDPETGKPINIFEPGPGSVWATVNKDARFGDFEAVDTANYLEAISFHQRLIAVISSTPLHNVIPMINPPSGEALKTLEARFVKKTEDRAGSFGNVWEEAISFARRIQGKAPATFAAMWEDAAPVSEKERIEVLGMKREKLDVPANVVQEEAGYPHETVNKWHGLTDEEDAAPERSTLVYVDRVEESAA